MALTNDGRNFLAYARDTEVTAAGALHSMRKEESKVHGCVRLGATYTGVGHFLMPVLARFRRSYPNVTVKLTEFKHAPLARAIRDGEVDLALIVASKAPQTRKLELERRILIRWPRGLWLSSAHPLMQAGAIYLADIANEPYVQFTADEAARSARDDWGAHGL